LSGCDKLTISPKLLEELRNSPEGGSRRLDPKNVEDMDIKEIDVNEKTFRWMHNSDQMSADKLAEGVRSFASDIEKLENIVRKKLLERK